MSKPNVWTTSLGGHKNAHALRSALANAGVACIGLADDLLHKRGFEVQQEEQEVSLIIRSVEQLGFTSPDTYERICARAQKRGFGLCPAGLGPCLSLQPDSRFSSELLYIGMQPMADGDGLRAIFGVGTAEGRVVLRGVYCAPRYLWGLQTRFVFVKPCKAKRPQTATLAALAASF